MRVRSLSFVIFVLFFSNILSNGYTNSSGLEPGDNVDLEYVGRIEGGEEIDRGTLLNQRVDQGLIVGFSNGLLGMKVGENKTITVIPSEGYTDPSHSLFGKTLIFEVYIIRITLNVRGEKFSESTSLTSEIVSNSEASNNLTATGEPTDSLSPLPIDMLSILIGMSAVVIIRIKFSTKYQK